MSSVHEYDAVASVSESDMVATISVCVTKTSVTLHNESIGDESNNVQSNNESNDDESNDESDDDSGDESFCTDAKYRPCGRIEYCYAINKISAVEVVYDTLPRYYRNEINLSAVFNKKICKIIGKYKCHICDQVQFFKDMCRFAREITCKPVKHSGIYFNFTLSFGEIVRLRDTNELFLHHLDDDFGRITKVDTE